MNKPTIHENPQSRAKCWRRYRGLWIVPVCCHLLFSMWLLFLEPLGPVLTSERFQGRLPALSLIFRVSVCAFIILIPFVTYYLNAAFSICCNNVQVMVRGTRELLLAFSLLTLSLGPTFIVALALGIVETAGREHVALTLFITYIFVHLYFARAQFKDVRTYPLSSLSLSMDGITGIGLNSDKYGYLSTFKEKEFRDYVERQISEVDAK